jgi:hypothetical protein
MIDRMTAQEVDAAAQAGTTIERSRSAKWELAEHRRLSAALARLLPGRKRAVDAFVLSTAIPSLAERRVKRAAC